MSIIGCDLHTRYQVIAALGHTDRGDRDAPVGTREWSGPSLLRPAAEAGPDWDRGHRVHGVVRADAGGVGRRVVGGRPGGESGAGGAASEDRHARRGAPADLLLRHRFPPIWIPTPEERDLRQWLKHRDPLVRMRTSVKNQPQFLAMSQGVCRRKKLWSSTGRQELEGPELGGLGESAAAGAAR